MSHFYRICILKASHLYSCQKIIFHWCLLNSFQIVDIKDVQNNCRWSGDCSHEIKRHLLLGRKAMMNLDNVLKCKDIALPTKIRIVKVMVFPVVMYRCESWSMKKAESWRIDAFDLWCWRRKTLESPLDCKEIQPVHPKGNQPWIFIERTDAKAENPILWPPDAKSQLTGKDPDAGKHWRKKEKGVAEDEMVR